MFMKLLYLATFFFVLLSANCNQGIKPGPDSNGNSIAKNSLDSPSAPFSAQKSEGKYWETEYFKIINNKLKITSLLSLNNKEIREGDIEVRLWVGFDKPEAKDLKGIILEKKAGEWAGMYLPAGDEKMGVQLQKPKSGWKMLWTELNKNDFLVLPDISQSKNNLFEDATCLVVEIKESNQYRNYMQVEDKNLEEYPDLRSVESTKLTRSCRTLTIEFGVPLC
jgi:hypothetical protein